MLDGSPLSRTNTAYFVFTGKGTALSQSANRNAAAGMAYGPVPGAPRAGFVPARPTLMDITDGTSNTILAIEARRDIPWTKPEDIPFDPDGPLPELVGFSPNGFNAAFADGAVRCVSKSMSQTILKALITRACGEVIESR